MDSEDLFPSKLATGKLFCNRVEERNLLKDNIAKSRHTVLVSPRRYGKSSLVHYVISELNIPFMSADLFLAHDDKTIVKRLLNGISEAVSRILPLEEKALETIRKIFSHFTTSLNFGSLQLELSRQTGEIDAVDQVYSALSALAKLASKFDKRVIVFIDEFQDIAAAQNAKSIQGAIRHIAQETSDLIFIFSGSNRHLLLELFDDKSMPLYMLCDKIHLERIASNDYRPHLQKLAVKRWGKQIPEMALLRLFALTELHPFYVNFLCNQLWKMDYPSSSQDIEAAWTICMNSETRRIKAEIEKLSLKQQDVLKALALHPTNEVTGKDFSIKSGVAASSLHQAIKALFEKDMIFKVSSTDPGAPLLKKGQVRVLDPIICYYLRLLS